MSRLIFVFPNHRAGVFFRDALHNASNGILIAPQITTISELLSEKTGLNTADKITLTFELYNVFCDVFSDNTTYTEFKFFYSWSPMFLDDFEDVDKNLINAELIFDNNLNFKNLSDDYEHLSDEQRKAIVSFWQEFNTGDKDYKRRFIEIFEKMDVLYSSFKERLIKKNLAYDGMIYRQVAEDVEKYFPEDDARYVFVGFNALTKAEIKIFKYLNDFKRADFFWDYSPNDYVSNSSSPKDDSCYGYERFINEHSKMFPAPKSYVYPAPKGFPKITLTNFAYPQGQVAQITEFVKKHYIDGKNKSTAIVLTDENMLLPVLSAIPTDNSVNVTMGYPIKFSQIYGFADLLQRLQSYYNPNGSTFYTRMVLAILQHPCVIDLCGKIASDLVNKIIKENIIHISIDELLKNNDNRFLKTIFKPLQSESACVAEYIISIFEMLFDYYVEKKNDDKNDKNIGILSECAYMVIKTANRFNDLLSQNSQQDSFYMGLQDKQLEFNMFVNLLSSETVDFCGMPLEGLQVMGILETRAVDFKKLIILDMNEGVFPKKSTGMTFIPSLLRHHYGMPTHEYQDAIFAYYFFRLIKRAEEVELLYTTTTDYEDRKGLSRFVMQLKYQYQREIETKTAIHRLNIHTPEPKLIKKNDTIMKRLHELYCGEWTDDCKFISPSAFSVYLECPVKFYFSKVMRINETNDIVEDAGNNDIGTIFHFVMEKLYHGDKTIKILDDIAVGPCNVFNDETRKRLLNNKHIIEKLIYMGFENTLKLRNVSKDSLIGRNRLYYEIIYQCVIKLIEYEPQPFTFLQAEEEVKGNIILNINNKEINVRLGGIIDRQHIDKKGKHWIIDYKTGKKQDTNIKELNLLFDSKKASDYKAVFQTLLYCKLLSEKSNSSTTLHPGILWIQELYKKDFNYCLTYNKEPISYNDEIKPLFDELFKEKITELFNPDIDFVSTNITKKCEYCPYIDLCKTASTD